MPSLASGENPTHMKIMNNRNEFRGPGSLGRRSRVVPLGLMVLACLLGAGVFLPGGALAQHPPVSQGPVQEGPVQEGKLSGRILGTPEGSAIAGTKVVLVEFKLDAQGQPQGRPVMEQEVDAEGRYRFEKVAVAPRVVFQLGATVAGRMVASQPFSFPAENPEVSLDLQVPRIVEDRSGLKIKEGVIVLEPRQGALWVTEVIHLDNHTGNMVEGEKTPLSLSLSEDAENFEWLRRSHSEQRHERLGEKLLVYGNIPPGRTTLAFRYQLDVPLGALKLSKQYPYPLEVASVLAPEGAISLEAEGFSRQPTRDIEGQRYNTWLREDAGLGQQVSLRISGIPIQQEWMLFSLIAFFLLVGGIAMWFMWVRLPAAKATHPEGA